MCNFLSSSSAATRVSKNPSYSPPPPLCKRSLEPSPPCNQSLLGSRSLPNIDTIPIAPLFDPIRPTKALLLPNIDTIPTAPRFDPIRISLISAGRSTSSGTLSSIRHFRCQQREIDRRRRLRENTKRREEREQCSGGDRAAEETGRRRRWV